MNDWTAFLNELDIARKRLSITHHSPWYRGLNNSDHKLIPKLFRNPKKGYRRIEREIYHRFLYVLSLEDQDYVDRNMSWHIIVKMQHHGTPTRLLDWTDSFAVALFFALQSDGAEPVSPCIWVANPYLLSAKAKKRDDKWLEALHLSPEYDYYKCFIAQDEANWPFESPLPFLPPTPTPRIIAQRGFFTIHGTDTRPLEEQCPKHVIKLDIPRAVWDDARKFLELAGCDRRSLFPDIDGFSIDVQKTYLD
jgi:hypothetical protein